MLGEEIILLFDYFLYLCPRDEISYDLSPKDIKTRT